MPSTTKIIGRHITYVEDGIEIEVDGSYVKSAIESYGLEESNLATTPVVKAKHETKEEKADIMLRRILEKIGNWPRRRARA